MQLPSPGSPGVPHLLLARQPPTRFPGPQRSPEPRSRADPSASVSRGSPAPSALGRSRAAQPRRRPVPPRHYLGLGDEVRGPLDHSEVALADGAVDRSRRRGPSLRSPGPSSVGPAVQPGLVAGQRPTPPTAGAPPDPGGDSSAGTLGLAGRHRLREGCVRRADTDNTAGPPAPIGLKGAAPAAGGA